jgi:hypothetical protein
LKGLQIFTPTTGTTGLFWAPKYQLKHCNTSLIRLIK